MSQQISTNTFGCAKWIVSSDATQGTHTTIAAALTSASSGDTIFIRPGTYTENLTLKAGVDLVAFEADALTPNVTIVGNCTLSTAGTVSISGIRLQTNSAAFLTVSGSVASIVYLKNCYLNCSNATGISFTSSSSSATINIFDCQGNIGTTLISLYASSSAGTINMERNNITNTGLSTTASTCSAGSVFILFCHLYFPLTSSSTATLGMAHNNIDTSAINTTSATFGGSGAQTAKWTSFSSGTASAVSVGSTLNQCGCEYFCSNTNAVVGAGNITYSDMSFTSSGIGFTTTTKTPADLIVGRFRSPTQPAFLAYQATAQTNATGNSTTYTLSTTTALTKVYDQGSNFNTTNGVFTAPVTGIYHFDITVRVAAITAAMTFGSLSLVTTGRTFQSGAVNPGAAMTVAITANLYTFHLSTDAFMNANDTATAQIVLSGGAGNTASVDGAANAVTYFSGRLVC